MSNRTVTQLGAIVLMASSIVPLSAKTQTVKGNTYADTAEVGVRTLMLIGAGLRERWWLDVYTMGAYAENRTCDPQMLISMDGAKSLRIDLLRDVDVKNMADALEDALDKNLPPGGSPGIRSQIDTFLGYFEKNLEKGDSMELTYVPGVGYGANAEPGAAGSHDAGQGVCRHPVGFLFQFRNLLFGAQEADSRPLFPVLCQNSALLK